MDHSANPSWPFFPRDQPMELSEHLMPYVSSPTKLVLFEDLILSLFELDQDIKCVLDDQRGEFPAQQPGGHGDPCRHRTSNRGGGDQTYGQTVPSLFPALNVGWGSSFITGARNDDVFRLQQLASPAWRLLLSFVWTTGSHPATAPWWWINSRPLPRLSMNQWSFEQLGVGTVEGPLTVEVWIEPDQASEDPCAEFPDANAFFAYVSKVDNLTGDAEFIYAYPMSPYICPAVNRPDDAPFTL